jgi:hypothetical protein
VSRQKDESDDPGRPTSKGGVFEELDASPAHMEIKVIDSHGARMALLQFRAGTVDDELTADLLRWYARNDSTLRLVK